MEFFITVGGVAVYGSIYYIPILNWILLETTKTLINHAQDGTRSCIFFNYYFYLTFFFDKKSVISNCKMFLCLFSPSNS